MTQSHWLSQKEAGIKIFHVTAHLIIATLAQMSRRPFLNTKSEGKTKMVKIQRCENRTSSWMLIGVVRWGGWEWVMELVRGVPQALKDPECHLRSLNVILQAYGSHWPNSRLRIRENRSRKTNYVLKDWDLSQCRALRRVKNISEKEYIELSYCMSHGSPEKQNQEKTQGREDVAVQVLRLFLDEFLFA